MRRMLSAACALAVLAAVATGCGDDSQEASDRGQTDSAFVVAMIPHHESAVEMAELAQKRAKHREIRQLADAIIESQNAEIAEMREMQSDLPKSNRSMMSESEMAAMHGDVEELRSADDFDRAFLAAMIPHHQSAVRMSQHMVDSGSDPRVRSLAARIIAAQNAEIADMREWSQEWYGSDVSSGSDHMMHGG